MPPDPTETNSPSLRRAFDQGHADLVPFEVVSNDFGLWQLGRRDLDPFMGEGLEVGD